MNKQSTVLYTNEKEPFKRDIAPFDNVNGEYCTILLKN